MALTMPDTFSRERLAICAEKSIKDEQVCDKPKKQRQPACCLSGSRPTTVLSLAYGAGRVGVLQQGQAELLPARSAIDSRNYLPIY